MNRPPLDTNLSVETFSEHYWLKEELVNFCRKVGISRSGGKRDISDRIARFLETGTIVTKQTCPKEKRVASFDWNHEILSTATIITDNYKNTENVRAFFEQQIGKRFKFNVHFMNWMKTNSGKTLGDAIEEWKRIYELKKDKNYKSEIAPQFEYNRYTRDFHAQNPGLSVKDAIKCWEMKRNKSGNHHYEDADLTALD